MGTRATVISICKGPAFTKARLKGAVARPRQRSPCLRDPPLLPPPKPPPPSLVPRERPGRAGSQATRFLAAAPCALPAGTAPALAPGSEAEAPACPGAGYVPGAQGPPTARRQREASAHPQAVGGSSGSRLLAYRVPGLKRQSPPRGPWPRAHSGLARAGRQRQRDGRAQRARFPAQPRPPGALAAWLEGPGQHREEEPGRCRPGRGSSSSTRAAWAAEGGAPSASQAFAGSVRFPSPALNLHRDCAPGPDCSGRRSPEKPSPVLGTV